MEWFKQSQMKWKMHVRAGRHDQMKRVNRQGLNRTNPTKSGTSCGIFVVCSKRTNLDATSQLHSRGERALFNSLRRLNGEELGPESLRDELEHSWTFLGRSSIRRWTRMQDLIPFRLESFSEIRWRHSDGLSGFVSAFVFTRSACNLIGYRDQRFKSML